MTLLRLAFAACLALASLPAHAFETDARAAWVYDVTTDVVLLSKNADEPLPPASMSKLMTLNMLFEALRDNPQVSMDTRFPVSARAAAMGGSTMFLNERDRPTVEELIQGIIVMSGNDACVVVAEGLAGSEDRFAEIMTQRARDLGMDDSTFRNASGWPAEGHRMSMQDLGLLAERLITEFPDLYGYFAQKEFEFDGRAPANRFNRNPLLGLGIGADGLKTGHTQEAGYGLVGSAAQGDRRVVFALTGLDSERARAEESERIVSWAFRQFVEKTVVEEGETVHTADVWLGSQRTIDLVAPEAARMLIPAFQTDGIEAEVRYTSPLNAPIAEGEEVATLVITLDGLPPAELPLVAASAVGKAGFVPRMQVAATTLLGRAMDRASDGGEAEAATE